MSYRSKEIDISSRYHDYYREFEKDFYSLSERLKFADKVVDYIKAKDQVSKFKHWPHLAHLGTNIVELYLNDSPASIIHSGIDYYDAYSRHEDNREFQRNLKETSSSFIEVVDVLSKYKSLNYEQALAKESFFLKINISELDEFSQRKFMALRQKVQSERQQFEHAVHVDQLKYIKDQNEAMLNLQDSILSRTNELAQIASKQYENLGDIQSVSSEIREDVSNIMVQLQQYHVDDCENLEKLLLQSEVSRRAVIQALGILKRQDEEKAEEERRVRVQQNYAGLYSSCQFMSQLADHIGSQSLKKVAVAASSGIKIYQAFSQIGQVSGLALLNPCAAIGMAGLNIISVFRGDNNDGTKVILKQLAEISRQLQSVHRDVLDGFERTNRHIHMMFKLTLEHIGNIHFLIRENTRRQLTVIESDLEVLLKLNQIGFQTLLLSDLSNTLRDIEYCEGRGSRAKEELYKEKFGNFIMILDAWIKSKSSNPMLTGLSFNNLLDRNNEVLLSVFEKVYNTFQVYQVIGLLASYVKDKLGLQRFSNIDTNKLVNSEIWLQALIGYVHLVKQKFYLSGELQAALKKYDPTQNDIYRMVEQVEAMREFIGVIQTSTQLYEILVSNILKCNQEISKLIQETINEFNETARYSVHARDVDEVIKSFDCNTPQRMKVRCVDVSKGVHKDIRKTVDVINQNPQVVIENLKPEWKILSSKSLLLLEFLNLADFNAKLSVYRHCLGFQRPNRRFGLDIEFQLSPTLGGKKYGLFEAVSYRKRAGKKREGDDKNPERIVKRAISVTGASGEKIKSHDEIEVEVSALLKKCLTDTILPRQQKELIDLISQKIESHPMLNTLKINIHLLINFMILGGFDSELIERTKALLNVFPKVGAINEFFIEEDEINAIKTEIIESSKRFSSIPFGVFTNSPVLGDMFEGLKCISELEVIFMKRNDFVQCEERGKHLQQFGVVSNFSHIQVGNNGSEQVLK